MPSYKNVSLVIANASGSAFPHRGRAAVSGSLRVRWCGVPPPAAVADGAARRRWACAVALSYRRRCSPPTPARDAPHWLDNRTVTDSGVTVDALLHPTLPLGLAGWEPG